jgi:hypothetical protein
VQTDWAISASREAFAAQAKNSASLVMLLEGPPGNRTMSGLGASAIEYVGVTVRPWRFTGALVLETM